MMVLCDRKDCSGCGACYNACRHDAIKMLADDEGFLYPAIDDDACVECGLCVKSCPVMTPVVNDRSVKAVYGAWVKNKDILKDSSSGGMFSVVAESVLDDGGVVVGAAYDENLDVRHIVVDNKADLCRLRGSKYVQSQMNGIYKEVAGYLKRNRKVLFTGTPCQVAGLYGSLGSSEKDNLITIDIICHGVPSPKVFGDYKKWLEGKYCSKLTGYKFRDKRWSWSFWNVSATFENGMVYVGKSEEDPFVRFFLRAYGLRHCCHHCAYTSTKRLGDLTLADFWHYPDRKDLSRNNQDLGISLVIVNSDKGKHILQRIDGYLVKRDRTIDEAKSGNRSLARSWDVNEKREEFWKDYHMRGFGYVMSKYLYPSKISLLDGLMYKYGKGSVIYIAFLFLQR